jgi:hypothetical protein
MLSDVISATKRPTWTAGGIFFLLLVSFLLCAAFMRRTFQLFL